MKNEKKATPLGEGQTWRNKKPSVHGAKQTAYIEALEGRYARVKMTEQRDGQPSSSRTERVPASMFGIGSSWELVE